MNVEKPSRKEVVFGDTGRWHMRRLRSTSTEASRWRNTHVRSAKKLSTTRTSDTSSTSSSVKRKQPGWILTSVPSVAAPSPPPTSTATTSQPARGREESITTQKHAPTRTANTRRAAKLSWTITSKGRTWKFRYQKITSARSAEMLTTKWPFWISISSLYTWTRNHTNVQPAVDLLPENRRWRITWRYTQENPNIRVPCAANNLTTGTRGGITRKHVLGRKRISCWLLMLNHLLCQ